MTARRDIKAAVLNRLEAIRELPGDEANDAIRNLIAELTTDRVAMTCEVAEPCKMTPPNYDPATDGDYRMFLVANNID